MIFDTVEHVNNYKGLGRVYEALEFLAKTDFSKLPLGKQELDGDKLFYTVQEYETAPDKSVESHFRYIDVQAVLEGEEVIGVAPIGTERTVLKESLESDYRLYDCDTQPLLLKAGSFLVLYPNDLHRPGLCAEAPARCRKVVFKVKCEA